MLFEHLASGMLHCASRAAEQAEERKQFNPWRMGTENIHPEVARDLFVSECIEHAAEHELKARACSICALAPDLTVHLTWPRISELALH